MSAVSVRKSAGLDVVYDGKTLVLPDSVVRSVEDYWTIRTSDNPSFRNGEVYHVYRVIEESDKTTLLTTKTDYAHYLWSINDPDAGIHACRVAFTAALVRTSDDQIVIGSMGAATSTPHRLQAPGGGLGAEDLTPADDRVYGCTMQFSLEPNIMREVTEEIGVGGSAIKCVTPWGVKSGGANGFFAAIYAVDLAVTADDVEHAHRSMSQAMRSAGGSPEFERLVFLPRTGAVARKILADCDAPQVDYLGDLIDQACELPTS